MGLNMNSFTNLKHLSDESLHKSIKDCVQKEREILTEVLYHLKEVDRRRLFSAYRYKSLYEYAEKELKYPGDQAYRRIAAMKLLRELPELETKISNGSLTLTHLSEVKSLFKKKPYSREEKLELFEVLSNTSTRTAQKILVKIEPEMALKDQVRPLTESKMEFKFSGTYTLENKLKELAGRYAHSHPGISLGDLIELLADKALLEFHKKYKLSS